MFAHTIPIMYVAVLMAHTLVMDEDNPSDYWLLLLLTAYLTD